MSQIAPLERQQAEQFELVFAISESVMGFVPNSMYAMARDPDLFAAFSQLAAVIVARPARIDRGLQAMIMDVASRSGGCQYCVAHCASLATRRGVPEQKVRELCDFESSAEFSPAERAALSLAKAAGQSPSAASDAHFAELHRHFSEEQILEMVAVIALMGFLNRWNDTLATTLEAAPREFAERNLTPSGWKLGKHAGPVVTAVPARFAVSLKSRIFVWLLRHFAPRPRVQGAERQA